MQKCYLQIFLAIPKPPLQVQCAYDNQSAPLHWMHSCIVACSLFLRTVLPKHAMLVGIVAVEPGTFHSMLVKQDGSVWSTGVSSDACGESFIKVIASGVVAAAAGTGYSIVLKQDGSVWSTGTQSSGELSFFDGSATRRRTFGVVEAITGAKAVNAGCYHSMVLTQEGHVWSAGWNKYGQLGDGSTDDKTRFRQVMSSGATAVAAGDSHSIVLKQDGSVWSVGRNYNGQLGDGSNDDKSSFVEAIFTGAVAAAAAGGYHTMVLKQDGSVWATGSNGYGQLGDGSTTDRTQFTRVVSSGSKTVATGRRHSLVLKQDGSVWATGYNKYGQLGTGLSTDSKAFVQVMLDGATTVAAGAFHSMVLKEDGSVWATGSNESGQFGDGTKVSKKTFVRLSPFAHGSKRHHDTNMACCLLRALLPFDNWAMHYTVNFVSTAKALVSTAAVREEASVIGN